MPSLNTRLLIAAITVLTAFLGLTGLALDRAFRDSALNAVQDRLRGQIYTLLGVADLDPEGRLVLPQVLPDGRFSTPASGLYASIAGDEGATVWRSDSMLGMDIAYPPVDEPGATWFGELEAGGAGVLFAMCFAVSWETQPGSPRSFVFQVAEQRAFFAAQVAGFRRSLWAWLASAAVVLIAVQGFILRWGLAPLRALAAEVEAIEAGERPGFEGRYPRELHPLTSNLNALIVHSRTQLDRYRNALADLAHSLKTPVAVVHNALEDPMPQEAFRDTVREQLARIDRTVDYQLQRAAASGRVALAAAVPLRPVVDKVTRALNKVYADKTLHIQVEIQDAILFHGDEGDLMEIVGNLADNAWKWAKSRVRVRARVVTDTPGGRPELRIEVADDGPGIPADRLGQVLQRGQRADPERPGQGIGLAVVGALVEEAYRGRVEIAAQGPLGGAAISVSLPA